MSSIGGPNIFTDNLILNYDSSNSKCFRGEQTYNIAPNTDYSDKSFGVKYIANSWGGDSAHVYYYQNGGFNNLPYKVMVKVSGGTGGSYIDEHKYFEIKDNTTYTISCYMKSSIPVTVNQYALCINRNVDNKYRVGNDINLTTEWKRYYWVYNSLSGHSGTTYQGRHIIYLDNDLPISVYWCGFQVEEGDYPTPYTSSSRGNNVSSGGGLLDLSKLKNNGTFYGKPKLLPQNNGVLYFNGDTDYVESNVGTLYNYTVDLWVNPFNDGGTTTESFLSFQNNSIRVHFTSTNYFSIRWRLSSGDYVNYNMNLTPLERFKWYNISYTFNETVLSCYINGVKTVVYNNVTSYQPTGGIVNIGKNYTNQTYLECILSNIKIYDSVLDDKTILNNYNSLKSKFK